MSGRGSWNGGRDDDPVRMTPVFEFKWECEDEQDARDRKKKDGNGQVVQDDSGTWWYRRTSDDVPHIILEGEIEDIPLADLLHEMAEEDPVAETRICRYDDFGGLS